MSSLSDVAKAEGFVKACTRLINFRLPTCKPTVDFQACFKSSIGTEDAANLVKMLVQTRFEMITILYQPGSTNDAKLASVESYLPFLFSLLDSTSAVQLQPIQYDRELTFEWSGCVTNNLEFTRSNDVVFEVIMVLYTKVVALSEFFKHYFRCT